MVGSLLEEIAHIDTGLDDTVWYSWRNRMPASSGIPVADFFASQLCPEASRVRLIGSRQNAALIVRLFVEQQQSGLAVELGTPRLASSRKQRDSSAALLVSLCNLSASPNQWCASIGGWHAVTESEAAIYQAVSRQQALDEGWADALHEHPLWAFLTFIPHLDRGKVSQLLVTLRDPRWYVDAQDPDSQKTLWAYLGLRRLESVPEARARAQLVKDCWKTTAEPPSCSEAPGGFLWRRWLDKADVPAVADLRASQCFVEYLRQVWLEHVYQERRKGAEALFVPEYFFEREDVPAAYRAHLANFHS